MTVFPFRFASLDVAFSWLTNVDQTYDTERRSQLRTVPRAVFKPRYEFTDAQTREAQALVELGDGLLSIPDWRYAQPVEAGFAAASLTVSVDTSYFAMAEGDEVVVWENESTFTETTIATIAGSSVTLSSGPAVAYGAAVLAPLYTGVVTGRFSASTRQGIIMRGGLELTITDYPDLSSHFAGDVFGGKYVAARNVIVAPHRVSYYAALTHVDTGLGAIQPVRVRAVDDWMDMVQYKPSFGQELLESEAIFHSLAGRLNSFWKPTWTPDFTLHTAATTGQFYLRVDVVPAGTSIDAVAIELNDGSTQYYEVSSWSTPGAYSQLTITTSVSADIATDEVTTLSNMRLSRLDTDDVSFKFDRVGAASVHAATVGVIE